MSASAPAPATAGRPRAARKTTRVKAPVVPPPADAVDAAVAPARQVSAEERHAMISAVAFRLAEARGFVPGQELDDWLRAEIQVDQQMAGEG